MTKFESTVCRIAENLSSWEIESLISELQMIADSKYQSEEQQYSLDQTFGNIPSQLSKLTIFA